MFNFFDPKAQGPGSFPGLLTNLLTATNRRLLPATSLSLLTNDGAFTLPFYLQSETLLQPPSETRPLLYRSVERL